MIHVSLTSELRFFTDLWISNPRSFFLGIRLRELVSPFAASEQFLWKHFGNILEIFWKDVLRGIKAVNNYAIDMIG